MSPVTTPCILIVDDFPVMRDILVFQLKAQGFHDVLTVGSGEEALRLLQHRRVNLILSDWSMPPGMSGLELLGRVRKDSRLAQTPFILITGEVQRDMVTQAIGAGVSDFLLKPFKPEEFAYKISSALAGKRHAVRLASHQQSATAVHAKDNARPTLLLVDDAPENLTLAARLLRDEYQVKLAASGDKALQLCKLSPPDLILLDVMMPGMDGFEVCRRLKEDAATAFTPVIFLTSLDDAEQTVRGLELGAIDYIGKPFEPAILKARVATALRVSQAHEGLREHYDLVVENANLRENVERIIRHDLRNPLTAIIGMVSRLHGQENFSDEQNRQIDAIGQAADDMLGLIHCDTELLKMEQGRCDLDRRPVDVGSLCRRIVDETILAFSAKGISVRSHERETQADAPWMVEGDSRLLYSMLHNLLRNAAEAVKPGETVNIELTDGDSVTIRISNPGRVPAEICDCFFEKFVTAGKKNGTGLGTYSARLIAEAHDGTIAMETSDETGTVLTVSLPKRGKSRSIPDPSPLSPG